MKIELPVIVETEGGRGCKITLLSDGSVLYTGVVIFHDDIEPLERGDVIMFDDINGFLKSMGQDNDSEIVIKKFKEMVSIWKSVFDKIGE